MNLQDVARHARVSTITVSRVINNTSGVKDATRKLVLKVVEELKYQPNLHARNLAATKSRSIGVIVSNIGNPFFLDIYTAIETRVRAAGYEIVMANTDYRSQHLVAGIRFMIGQRVAGLAAIVSEIDPKLIDELNEYAIPVVFCDVATQGKNITNIRVNYRRGMDKLTDYLYEMGHRRIGVAGHCAMLRPVDERVKVALESLARYPDVAVRTATDMDSPEGGRRAAGALLSAHPELTALMFVNDFMALGAMREIRERGLRVPEDISVTGFDDLALAQFWNPALTSVHIARDRMGQMVCDALFSDEKGWPGSEVAIDPELVLRSSTGAAARS